MAFSVEPGSRQSQEVEPPSPKTLCDLTIYDRTRTLGYADMIPRSTRTQIQPPVWIKPGITVCQRHPNTRGAAPCLRDSVP